MRISRALARIGVLATVLISATGCQVNQTMFGACNDAAGPFGTDGAYVLHCRVGVWEPTMTVQEYAKILRREPVTIAPVPTRPTPSVPQAPQEPAAPPATPIHELFSVAAPVLDVDHRVDSVEVSWAPSGSHHHVKTEVSWRSGGGDSGSLLTTNARATVSGLVANEVYTFNARFIGADNTPVSALSQGVDIRYVDTTLPVIEIDTNDQAILDKITYVGGTLSVDPNGTSADPISGSVEIRGRGNSTWLADKLPYRIKLGAKSALLGMPANRHWVLLSNPYDPSSIRTLLMAQFGQASSLAWTPAFRPVELILNGRYDGIYLLGEHVRVDSTRIAIDPLTPQDNVGPALTGGYHLELDARWTAEEDPGFATTFGDQRFNFALKDPEEPTAQQLGYISSYVESLQQALLTPDLSVADVEEFLDVESYIDWYLINELTRNQDAWFASLHMYKPRNAPLHFGPLWDFDLTMGSTAQLAVPSPAGQGLLVAEQGWSKYLNREQVLGPRIRQRWAQLRPAIETIVDQIPLTEAPLASAKAADRLRWGRGHDPASTNEGLQTWLRAQIDYLSNNL